MQPAVFPELLSHNWQPPASPFTLDNPVGILLVGLACLRNLPRGSSLLQILILRSLNAVHSFRHEFDSDVSPRPLMLAAWATPSWGECVRHRPIRQSRFGPGSLNDGPKTKATRRRGWRVAEGDFGSQGGQGVRRVARKGNVLDRVRGGILDAALISTSADMQLTFMDTTGSDYRPHPPMVGFSMGIFLQFTATRKGLPFVSPGENGVVSITPSNRARIGL